MKKGTAFLMIILILLTLLISACTKSDHLKPKTSQTNEKPKDTSPSRIRDWQLPISIPEGEFYRLAGWLSDTQVVYITNHEQTSNVYRYDLLSGKSELLYHSDYTIVNLLISPSKKHMLIHSSPSSYEGLVTIIDRNGTERLRESIPSYELVFEWNPYNESEVLVSKFDEDWTFQVMLLDMEQSKTTALSLTQPFVKWLSTKNIAYLNWDEENPTLVAPLLMKELESGKETVLFEEAIQFAMFREMLLTISVKERDSSKALYSFYDKQLKELFSFSIPLLSKFSDWLVPFFDYNESTGCFITFQPVTSGEADSYTEGFDLVEYSVQKKRNQLLMEGLENEPVQFSPSGEAVLYGNSFEKIIDLQERKIYQVIDE